VNETLTDVVVASIGIDKHLIAEFVELTLKKREMAREKTKMETRLKELTEIIVDQFVETETVESLRVMGYNVKPKRELWAGAKDGDFERSCNVLVDSGHGEYVNRRFDSRSVSALIREYDREGEIPEELQEGLEITEKWKLSMTKGGKK
jgi:hypothetical protein